MTLFMVDKFNHYISIAWTDEIFEWVKQYPTMYNVYAGGVSYTDDSALNWFLLRWS